MPANTATNSAEAPTTSQSGKGGFADAGTARSIAGPDNLFMVPRARP